MSVMVITFDAYFVNPRGNVDVAHRAPHCHLRSGGYVCHGIHPSITISATLQAILTKPSAMPHRA